MTTNLQREKKSTETSGCKCICHTFTLPIKGDPTHHCCDDIAPPTDTTVEKWRLEFVKIRERNYKEKWGDQVALVEEIQFIEKLIALSVQEAKAEARSVRSSTLKEVREMMTQMCQTQAVTYKIDGGHGWAVPNSKILDLQAKLSSMEKGEK